MSRLCTRGYGDFARSVLLARRRKHSKAGQFNTRRLRLFESLVLKVGGCGLPGSNVDDLWDLFFEWESDRSPQEEQPKRRRDYFPNPHALREALVDDIDEAVDQDGWYSCALTEIQETSEAYYRSVLSVLVDALERAPKVRYWTRQGQHQGLSECCETPLDEDAFRRCE